MANKTSTVSLGLLALIAGLLAAGIVSGTALRHIIQVLPCVLVLFLVQKNEAWGIAGSLPVFLFWLACMALIWLSLPHITRIVHGRFNPAEMVLTLIIAAAGGWGAIASSRAAKNIPTIKRMAAFVLFLALQWATFWLSHRPFISHR